MKDRASVTVSPSVSRSSSSPLLRCLAMVGPEPKRGVPKLCTIGPTRHTFAAVSKLIAQGIHWIQELGPSRTGIAESLVERGAPWFEAGRELFVPQNAFLVKGKKSLLFDTLSPAAAEPRRVGDPVDSGGRAFGLSGGFAPRCAARRQHPADSPGVPGCHPGGTQIRRYARPVSSRGLDEGGRRGLPGSRWADHPVPRGPRSWMRRCRSG